MTIENSNKESRTFRMDPALLFSVIKAQAGTLSKAVLELVMNSIDAGATRVDITLDRKKMRITDDGKGFSSREEVDAFFETFGTPHQDGDATYGRFRMGRGQIMSFALNQWRSGTFRMDVDIQGRGLDYTLETGLDAVVGCQIDGQLYDALDPSELINNERTLKDQCRYTPVPVYLNGKLLSEDPAKQKWTRLTDEAYILADSSRTLAVYNLGVLVSNFDASDFGVGGVVVSRKQLDLNFARNDILRNKCTVWRSIRPVLSALSSEMNGKEPAKRRTEEWRVFQAQRMSSLAQISHKEYQEIVNLPLFTDIGGKHMSLWQLYRQTYDRKIVIAPEKSLTADKVHQSRIACVLLADTFKMRFRQTLTALLDHLDTVSVENYHGRAEQGFADYVAGIRKALDDFATVSDSIKSDHHVLDASKIPKDVAAALKTIRDSSHNILAAVNGPGPRRPDAVLERKYLAMESETAEAYTDGRANIFLNVKLLRGAKGPNNGAAWAAKIAAIIVHEYSHDFDSGTGHIHDSDFYETFHDAVTTEAFGYAVTQLLMNWARNSKEDLGKVSSKLLTQIDRQTSMDDRQERAEMHLAA